MTPKPLVRSNILGVEIYGNVWGYGRLSPTRFEVQFSNLSHDWNRRLNMSIENASMPGRSVATSTYKTAGPKREMPYELLYNNEATMVFRVGEDMLEKLIFEDWMNRVAPFSSGFINYYNTFVQEVSITQLDRFDNEVMKVVLSEVYPKAIGELDFGQSKSDEYQTIQVNFTYKDYAIVNYVPYVQKIKEPLLAPKLSGNPYQGNVSDLPTIT